MPSPSFPTSPDEVLGAWLPSSLASAHFDLAGLLVLADLSAVALRTALTGSSSPLDALLLAPGLHRQTAEAQTLARGEHPACAALTTGYVFRVENPATVAFFQRVARPGHLTTLSVHPSGSRAAAAAAAAADSPIARLAYSAAVALTPALALFLARASDVAGVTALAIFVLARALNVAVVRRRAQPGWFGKPEPGARSELLVLLSQDRWVRLRGATDDVKAVTSGTWMRKASRCEEGAVCVATLLTFLGILATANATRPGQVLLALLLLVSAALLGLANASTTALVMHGRSVRVERAPMPYMRRLDLAHELIREFGRTDCFVGMGMIQPRQAEEAMAAAAKEKEKGEESYVGPVTM